jgi:hypothetical protein
MANTNDGELLPGHVARSWADAIEGGIDSLRIAIVSDPMCHDGEGFFLVHRSCSEQDAERLVSAFYAGTASKCLGLKVLRLGQLPQGLKDYLLGFAEFCRDSGGFEQW